MYVPVRNLNKILFKVHRENFGIHLFSMRIFESLILCNLVLRSSKVTSPLRLSFLSPELYSTVQIIGR